MDPWDFDVIGWPAVTAGSHAPDARLITEARGRMREHAIGIPGGFAAAEFDIRCGGLIFLTNRSFKITCFIFIAYSLLFSTSRRRAPGLAKQKFARN